MNWSEAWHASARQHKDHAQRSAVNAACIMQMLDALRVSFREYRRDMRKRSDDQKAHIAHLQLQLDRVNSQVSALYAKIGHGDAAHRLWLMEEIDRHFGLGGFSNQ